LDAKTGENIWALNSLEQFGGEVPRWGLCESLLIDGDRVICCPGGEETAVVALDKLTGETVWKSPTAGDIAGYATPILVEHQGLRMIITMTAKAIIGVAADDGRLLWRFEHTTPYDENILLPIFHDGHVFVSTQVTGSLKLRIDVEGDKATVEEVWRSEDLDNQHGGVLLLNGFLYGSCAAKHKAQWVCLDWKTGEMMYADRGVGKGSLTYADGMLYCLGEKGTMGLVKPTPTGHEIVSQFKIPKGPEGPSWAHPVVCDGRLYIRHADRLYAFVLRPSDHTEMSPEGGPDGPLTTSNDQRLGLLAAPLSPEEAKRYQAAWAEHLDTEVEFENSIGMALILVPPGTFNMGSTEAEIKDILNREHEGDWDASYYDRVGSEGPRHRVKISRPFYIGQCEVTQAEYARVMGGNPSHFSATGKGKDDLAITDTDRLPVETVAWGDAVEFCRKLSALPSEKLAGRRYRLPTEAEWEYACRAGSVTIYCFGSDEAELPEYAWLRENSGGRTHQVGTRKPNSWGLHDMHGNLWEWCADWYHNKYYAQSPEVDPPGPQSGSLTTPDNPSSGTAHILRGGAWTDTNRDWFMSAARSPSRGDDKPSHRYGFRVVCVVGGE